MMSAAEFQDARKTLRLTQEQLGNELDLTRKAVSDLERGVYPINRRTEYAVRYLVQLRCTNQTD